MKINFDGVTGTPEQYIPAEIKVVTYRGEKHYDRTKAFFNEKYGFGMLPEDVSQNNWSVETKAAHYGIPPYYYTQLQQQILGLNAPFGYLSVLFDKTWDLYSFYVWRDEKVLNALIVEGYKVWQQILERRGPNWQIRAWYGFDLDGTLAKFSNFKPEAIGAPIPPMIATLQRLVEQGKYIKIFTARVNSGTS